MTSTIILRVLLCSSILTIATMSRIHPCYIEPYSETFILRDCSTRPIEIETTRCRGQCYSEDFLVYDWQAEPTYRHKHQIQCCSPNTTISREIPIVCSNKQQRFITYPFVTRCNCKLCTDSCNG